MPAGPDWRGVAALRPLEEQDLIAQKLEGSYVTPGNTTKKRNAGFMELVFAIKTET